LIFSFELVNNDAVMGKPSKKKEQDAPIPSVDEIARRFLNIKPQPKIAKKKKTKKQK